MAKSDVATPGKDRESGKATYPAAIGLPASKELAARTLEEAVAALAALRRPGPTARRPGPPDGLEEELIRWGCSRRSVPPRDLRDIPVERLPELAAEIRSRLVEVVSANGGHLARARRRRADHRPPPGLRFPLRQDHLGRLPPVLHPQAPHRPQRVVRDPAPPRGGSRIHQPGGEPSRRLHGGSRGDVHRHRPRACPRRDRRAEKHEIVAVIGDGSMTSGWPTRPSPGRLAGPPT